MSAGKRLNRCKRLSAGVLADFTEAIANLDLRDSQQAGVGIDDVQRVDGGVVALSEIGDSSGCYEGVLAAIGRNKDLVVPLRAPRTRTGRTARSSAQRRQR